MNRHDRDRYDRNEYGLDYNRYEGYSQNDEHYHSARNLTNEFEQEYQREHGYQRNDRDFDRIPRSYHEGDMGDAYEQRQRNGRSHQGYFENQWNDRDQSRNYGNSRNSFRNDRDDYSRDRDRYTRDRNQSADNLRQGYGVSNFGGTSDRYNTLNSSNRGGSDNDRDRYSGPEDGYRNTRFSGSMGDSFPGSNRGIPDATYGKRDFSDRYGSGMGSTYGGQNYGGGTGYSSGHRGGSFGNSIYGTSAGNYSGYGAMGGGSYGGRSSSGRGETSHNTDRGTNELGGF